MNFLDRNEFNFEPSQKVIDTIKNFDPKELCFYTRIYDEGKKSVVSVRLSEIYGVPEEQVLLGYGGEEILKNTVHYYLTKGNNKTILIPQFSWWYYSSIAAEVEGVTEMYPLYEQDDTFAYNVDEVIEYTNRIHPRLLLLASPNNPTGNSLTSEEIGRIKLNPEELHSKSSGSEGRKDSLVRTIVVARPREHHVPERVLYSGRRSHAAAEEIIEVGPKLESVGFSKRLRPVHADTRRGRKRVAVAVRALDLAAQRRRACREVEAREPVAHEHIPAEGGV